MIDSNACDIQVTQLPWTNKNNMPKITCQEFKSLLNTVAEGWNTGNFQKAADCFCEDAVYMEPPNKKLLQNKNEIFDFFVSLLDPEEPLHLSWHYLVFDEEFQIGSGEFTCTSLGRLSHGMAMIKIVGGKIKRWREYQYPATENWISFIGKSTFWKI